LKVKNLRFFLVLIISLIYDEDLWVLGKPMMKMISLKEIIDDYMKKVPGLKEYCEKCLRTERYGGNVVLMIVDAAFTSIGLNYFTVIIPKVEEFNKKFIESGKIRNLKDLANANIDELRKVWKNKRSWIIAKEISSYLSSINENDKIALRTWAKNAKIENWEEDPIGRIKGVGLVTFQYLRMMGGIDTIMPDKIVKRVINEILIKAGLKPINNDIEFIRKTEEIALSCGYRPIELCFMTWFIQYEGKAMRIEKYSKILSKI
jgi:hypothetical protein